MKQSGEYACPQLAALVCRQAALEALQTVLEAFSKEDHFEAVSGPLLATPLQHTQAAASTSGQVNSCTRANDSTAWCCMLACLLACLLAELLACLLTYLLFCSVNGLSYCATSRFFVQPYLYSLQLCSNRHHMHTQCLNRIW